MAVSTSSGLLVPLTCSNTGLVMISMACATPETKAKTMQKGVFFGWGGRGLRPGVLYPAAPQVSGLLLVFHAAFSCMSECV